MYIVFILFFFCFGCRLHIFCICSKNNAINQQTNCVLSGHILKLVFMGSTASKGLGTERKTKLLQEYKNLTELIVYGFIRQKLQNILPLELIQLILNYYHEILEWDFVAMYLSPKRDFVSIWDNKKNCTFTKNAIKMVSDCNPSNGLIGVDNYKYRTITSKNPISSSKYSKCYYEILIENVEKRFKQIRLFIGYFALSSYRYKVMRETYDDFNQFSVLINSGNHRFTSYNSNCNHTNNRFVHGIKSKINKYRVIKIGDRFGIEIDFIENKSYFYHNGECIGIMFKNNIKNFIVLSISVSSQHLVISCPLLLLFPRYK